MLERLPAFFWRLVAICVAAVGAEIAILLLARVRLTRQERLQRLGMSGDWQSLASLRVPSRLLELAAAIIPLFVALLFLGVIQGARLELNRTLGMTADRSQLAEATSVALAQEMNATPVALWGIGATSLIGCVAAGTAISARLRARGLQRAGSLGARADAAWGAWLKFPGPRTVPLVASILAFPTFGLGPIWLAAMGAIHLRTQAFSEVTAAIPDLKGKILNRALDEALGIVEPSLLVSRVGIAIAVGITGVLAWRFSSVRARAQAAPGPASKAAVAGTNVDLALACTVTVLAVLLFVSARPMREENRLPWPPYEGGERLMAIIPTPDLEGPDVMVRAPVLHVTLDSTGLDGSERDATSIAGALATLHQRLNQVRPKDPSDGVALLVCQAETPIQRVSAVLRASLAGGFARPMFVFLRRQVTDRPLIGRLWRNRSRAAQTTLVEAPADAGPAAAVIEIARFPTCAALSAEIVTARRAGREVALLLPRP